MDEKENRQTQAEADVDVAHPRPYDFRPRVIETQGGHDQYRIPSQHRCAPQLVSPTSPTTLHMQWNKRSQQHQRDHGRCAVHHEQKRAGDLPCLTAARRIFHLVGSEPGRASREQNRKGGIDGESQAWTKPQGTPRFRNRRSSAHCRSAKQGGRPPGNLQGDRSRPALIP
jgi:hypothetical protein